MTAWSRRASSYHLLDVPLLKGMNVLKDFRGRCGGCTKDGESVGAASATWWLFAPFETVDDKTDEISYRFPIVNARKLSLSFSSLPPFFSSLYGIFFRDRECTQVNEQLSDRKGKKRNIAPVFSTRYTTLKQYFYFRSMILPPPSFLSSTFSSAFNVSDICPVPI